MQLNNPERFEEAVHRLTGRLKIRPATGARFNASLRLCQCDKVGMLTVRAGSLAVSKEPPHDFICLNIPLGMPFLTNTQDGYRLIDRHEAHLFGHSEEFNLIAKHGCQAMGVIFPLATLVQYRTRLCQSERPLRIVPSLSLTTPAGSALLRALAQLWSSIESGGGPALDSPIAQAELEDELVARFILAVDTADDERGTGVGAAPSSLNIAEEFLVANLSRPVTRDDLADVTGVSIRTLSRAFMKKHGTGPIGFLKQCRLDATYKDLTGAESGTRSVTDIALIYGFNHLGKFSIDYRKTFGESPSTSLSH